MTVAGVMIAHQVAAKAVRDAVFLSAWPATDLPKIVITTAIAVVVAVPVYSKLLGRFSPRVVVPIGFLLSAIGHLIEWRVAGTNRWVAVAIYLHIAGMGALLLSGFWSLISELFDPRSAKTSYGRIAAAGTVGGMAGGLATAQLARAWPDAAPLLMLACLHAATAIGLLVVGRVSPALPSDAVDRETAGRVLPLQVLRGAPHLRTLALMIVLSTTAAAILDFVFKSQAARPEQFGTRAQLLQFFAVFYTALQLVTFLAQTSVGASLRALGLGRTISILPAGLGASTTLALIFQSFPMFAFARGVESVLRGSVFRSGYELLFVPMDPAEKRRAKTFLDVTCDRAGDAVGAVVVQLTLFTYVEFQRPLLLAVVIGIAAAGLYLAGRLDTLYLGVVARRLVKHGERTPIVVGSETGWTVIDMPVRSRSGTVERMQVRPPPPPRIEDPRLKSLAELRSGDRRRVEQALAQLSDVDTMQIAQVVQLLAWDDVVALARPVLEAHAGSHIGLFVDELLDPGTDFAIRRRVPRILGTVATERALNGLVRGLDDARFEVRYQCGRAIDRLLTRNDGLRIDERGILGAVDRELSVSPQVWQGHHLIDHPDRDDEAASSSQAGPPQRNLEHVFTLLSAVLPREPLQVAYHGIRSTDAGLRSLAVEYLDGVLPLNIRTKLWALVDAAPPARGEARSPEQALEELRKSASAQLPVVRPDAAATPSSDDAPAQSGPPRTTKTQ
jgi:AAA family ATP:ADP antiporter